ncbi:MAG: amidohydrolase family protein [Chitinophagaceae bacterium]
MQKTIFALLLLIGLSASAQQIANNRQQAIVISNVNVLTMDGSGKMLEKQTVVIRDGRITHLGQPRIKFKEPPIYIDGTGKFLMPGLAEMHAHVPPVDELEPMKDILLLFAFNGVTTIRGMLGHPRHLELRSKIASGEILGPRFYTSGPSINGNSVSSPARGAAMVREQKKAGYDFLKLHPGLSVAKFDSIAAAAHEVGIPFAGHVSYDVGVWRAIDAGYASIDHLDGFVESLVPGIENIPEQEAGIFGLNVAKYADSSRIPRLMKALKDKNIWVVPTQALAERWFSPGASAATLRSAPEMKYMSSKTLDQWESSKNNLQSGPGYDEAAVNQFVKLRRDLIRACSRYGVPLLLGSDAPQVFNVPGFSLHHELKYLVGAGLTTYEALMSGTANVGKFLERPDIGVIKVGAVSDLILLSANPLIDINNTSKIEGVMMGTNWMPKEYIAQEMKKLVK